MPQINKKIKWHQNNSKISTCFELVNKRGDITQEDGGQQHGGSRDLVVK